MTTPNQPKPAPKRKKSLAVLIINLCDQADPDEADRALRAACLARGLRVE